jgi:hypothetical protein
MSVSTSVPNRTPDNPLNQTTPTRTGFDGSAYTSNLSNKEFFFADEGSFFVATNATVGTGIAGHAAPVVADTSTKMLLHVFNGNAAGGKWIYPQYLKLRWTAIGANGTSTFWVCYIDNKGSTAATSGGTATTPVNTNSGSSLASGGVVTFGAVATTFTSARKVGAFQSRSVIQVAEDTQLLTWGQPNQFPITGGVTNGGNAILSSSNAYAPLAIAPGGNFGVAQITVAQTAASSFDYEFGFVER